MTMASGAGVTSSFSSSLHIQYIEKTFSDSTSHGNFNHLVVDQNTGRLYIGAINQLYQLSETLVPEKVINTGPKDDSPYCPAEGQDCICNHEYCDDFIRRPTNSISKALVIDYSAGKLIACTNLFQGQCEKRSLQDISQIDDTVFKNIVPNDETSPAVFIGPGPSNEVIDTGQSKNRLVLYVVATRSTQGLDLYKDLVPNLSSRDLSSFNLAAKDISRSTKINLRYRHRFSFKVNYVDGFISGGFSYIVAIQPEKLDTQNSEYISKIIRVCQKDRKFYSFAEVDLQYHNAGKTYNILRAIDVAHPGAHLASSLGLSYLPPLSHTEDVLFALFSRSKSQSMEPLEDSVMCMFPCKEIRCIFTENIQDCFRGICNTGPAHITVPDICIETDFAINDDYCGTYEFNNPIAGTKPISANAIIHFDGTLVSSIAVTDIHGYTVAFIGTASGTIKKVVVESVTNAREYDMVGVNQDSPIARDMNFDRSKSHVYVMSKEKVSMVKVQQCNQFQNCGECLGAQDPYCGWCMLESKCSLKMECTNANDILPWLPYRNSQCTTITKVIPEQVQTRPSGVTELMLHVENLPSIASGRYFCTFSGYGVVRMTHADIRGSSSEETTHVHCKTPDNNLLPPIPTGKDHIVLDLSVRMNNTDFVSHSFTFLTVHYTMHVHPVWRVTSPVHGAYRTTSAQTMRRTVSPTYSSPDKMDRWTTWDHRRVRGLRPTSQRSSCRLDRKRRSPSKCST